MKMLTLPAIAVALLMPGCATLMSGAVTKKLNDQEARVAMGSDEVKPGERVALYEEHCNYRGGGRRFDGGRRTDCTKERVGEGIVTNNIDKNYSVVRVEPGAKFGFGTRVEKITEGAAH